MRCDVTTAAQPLSRLVVGCADNSPWRNALDQMNDIVAFRIAMKQELMT